MESAEHISISLQKDEVPLLFDFVQKSLDQITDLEEVLLAIEESEGKDEEKVGSLFRTVHTIKGTAGFFQLNTIVRLSHKTETVLDRLRQKTLAADADTTDCLLACIDRLSQALKSVDEVEGNVEHKKDESVLSFPDIDITDSIEWLDSLLAKEQRSPVERKAAKGPEPPLIPPPVPEKHIFPPEQKNDFNCEALEQLDAAEAFLVDHDNLSSENFNDILRSFHTIKGNSGLLLAHVEDEKERTGHILNRIQIVAHHGETYLEALRESNLGDSVKDDHVTTLLQTLDTLRKMLDAFSAGETGPDVSEVVRTCDAGAQALLQKGEKPRKQEGRHEKLQVLRDKADRLQNGIKLIVNPENRNEAIDTLQSILIEISEGYLSFLPENFASESEDAINVVNFLASDWNEDSAAMLLPDVERFVEKLHGEVSETLKKQPAPTKKHETPQSASPSYQRQESTRHATVIKVPQPRLDAMMNLIGELLVSRNALNHLTSNLPCGDKHQETVKRLREMCHEVDRIGDSLQSAIMTIRMTPVNHVFARFPRLVRDLSQKLKKEIQLHVEGAETELDRKVIDAIGDPLVHLIRNAADHGIETTEERRAAGKPPTAVIQLEAINHGQSVTISISDDGRGINAEAVAKKALKIGTTKEKTLLAMTDDEKRMLIFTPGLSSAQQISEVSGRGVGMDVVRQGIEGVGGTITLSSTPGKGTRVNLNLPLSLAVNRGLEVEVSGEHYYLPLEYVLETVKVSPTLLHHHRGECMAVIRRDLLPVKDLASELGLHSLVESSPEEELISLVILQMGDQKIALRVDRFHREEAYVLKNLTGIVGDIPWVLGAMVTVNGKLVLVLDPVKFNWV